MILLNRKTMTIRKYYTAFLLFGTLLAGTSCQKDFLNKGPLSQYSDNNVWTDSALVNRFVLGIYGNIICTYDWPGNNYGYLNQTMLPATITDEMTTGFLGSTPDQINMGQYNAASNIFDNIWTTNASTQPNGQTGIYENVRNCNLFLAHLPTMPLSQPAKLLLTAQVRFLRAYNYYYLYNIFGRFPIIDTVLNISDPKLFTPRSSDDSCINYMLSDLNFAAANLPSQYPSSGDLGRVTAGGALGMKCRILLNQKRYADASAVALSLINNPQYQLFNDYGGIFYPANIENSEVIFDKGYGGDLTGQNNNMDIYENSSFFTGFSSPEDVPTQNLVDQYLMTDGLPWNQSPLYDPAHPYANRDPRLTASVIYDGTTWMGNTIDMRKGSAFNPATQGTSPTGYLLRKFLNPNYIFYGNNKVNASCIIIRLAEIYLNYAECQLKLGNPEEARKYVNLLRERQSVNMPDIPAGQMTWDAYVRERTVELAFEGERRADIRRWDKGADLLGATIYGMSMQDVGGVRQYNRVQVQQRVFDPKMYLFPIPYKELTKYPAGQVLEQNPGWQ